MKILDACLQVGTGSVFAAVAVLLMAGCASSSGSRATKEQPKITKEQRAIAEKERKAAEEQEQWQQALAPYWKYQSNASYVIC